jgi:hypothetical protein
MLRRMGVFHVGLGGFVGTPTSNGSSLTLPALE